MKPYLIRQMGHLALQTTDLSASVAEAEAITGLRVVDRTANRVTLTTGRRRGEVTFFQGTAPAALAIGLEAYDAAAVEEIRSRALARGLDVFSEQPLAPEARHGVRFRTPWGHIIEAHTPVPRDQPSYYQTAGVRPLRLDHASLKAPDTLGLRDLLADVLGLRESDRTAGNEFLWMRAGDLMHHTIGIVIAPEAGLHHYSFEAAHLTDLARVGDTLRGLDRTLLWGLGHHGANAQNYFTYHVDGHGCIVEYSHGMTRIDDDEAYGQGQVWAITPELADDWINMWGAPPPRSFGTSGLTFAPEPAAARPA